jgi:hypothetical protein
MMFSTSCCAKMMNIYPQIEWTAERWSALKGRPAHQAA